jgi:hypothetical protein
MQTLFIICWCIGVAGWFYGARFWLPMWAVGFRRRDRHKGYWLKSLLGFGIFLLAAMMGIAAAMIADTWGGGWNV